MDPRSFYADMADRCAEVAAKAGVISELERRTWLDRFHDRGLEAPSSLAVYTSSSGAASRHEAMGRHSLVPYRVTPRHPSQEPLD
jgi:hypothetical protein